MFSHHRGVRSNREATQAHGVAVPSHGWRSRCASPPPWVLVRVCRAYKLCLHVRVTVETQRLRHVATDRTTNPLAALSTPTHVRTPGSAMPLHIAQLMQYRSPRLSHSPGVGAPLVRAPSASAARRATRAFFPSPPPQSPAYTYATPPASKTSAGSYPESPASAPPIPVPQRERRQAAIGSNGPSSTRLGMPRQGATDVHKEEQQRCNVGDAHARHQYKTHAGGGR